MSEIKFYPDVYNDYVREYRIKEDRTYRKLNGDYTVANGDFISEDSFAVRNHIVINSSIEINGVMFRLNPTSGTLDDRNCLHTCVYVKRTVKPEIPSREQLIQIVENGDDQRSNALVLNVLGNFELRDMNSIDYFDPTIVVRYESFIAGNGYIGSEAASDENFIHSLYSTALEEWRDHLETGRVNNYRDDFSHDNIDDLKAEIDTIVIQ